MRAELLRVLISSRCVIALVQSTVGILPHLPNGACFVIV
jgi:hypothetical protein